jgi:murein DD-endopeptidase MepM/ murein hydrolase activator NlpD
MKETSLPQLLEMYRGKFAPVVPFTAGVDKLLEMDFTASNKTLSPEILGDTPTFTRYIEFELEKAGARYGIGGYAEHRTVYSRSPLFDTNHDASQQPAEPRRFHLGIVIWGKAGTPVFIPLDGTVHSFAFNNSFGDYGATVLLSHRLESLQFFTLYGHVNLDSINFLETGRAFKKGSMLARFGEAVENGNWPPHLHFQVITDMQGRKGDFPGVCRYSEKEQWLSNCPDPDLLLDMLRFAKKNDDEILKNDMRHFN